MSAPLFYCVCHASCCLLHTGYSEYSPIEWYYHENVLVKLLLTTILCVSLLGISFLYTCISYTHTHKHVIYVYNYMCLISLVRLSTHFLLSSPNILFFLYLLLFSISRHTHIRIHNSRVVRGDNYIHTYIHSKAVVAIGYTTLPLGHMGLGQRSVYFFRFVSLL